LNPVRATVRDWSCSFRIVGFEPDIEKKAFGVDSLQALLLAVRMLHSTLQYEEKTRKGKFGWLKQRGVGL
jgi:hypothetical protein